MPVRIDKLNNVWCRIVWLGRGETESTYANPLSLLDGYFSIYAPNYQFDPRFKNRKVTRYDGKFHLFRKDLGVLPLGLTQEAVKLLRDNSFEVHIDDAIKLSFKNEKYNEDNIISYIADVANVLGFPPYYYQSKALHIAVKNKRVLFESPTGSGKSLTIYLILRYLQYLHREDADFRILIMVPSRVLVTQLYRDFSIDYKWGNASDNVGMYSSDFTKDERVEALSKKVLISTYDSIDILLNEDKEFCERFRAVFLDEAHKAREPKESKRVTKILNSCTSAEYRYGLTGTIPKNKLFEKSLEGSFAKKVVLTETSDLQKEGVLSNCEIYHVNIPYDVESKKFIKTNKVKYPEEVELVRLNNSKLYSISSLINNGHIGKDQNTLILCNKIENGELESIVEHIKKNHKEFTVEVIYGGISGKERDKIITSINNRDGVIIVATYATMSTGVNIKKLHNCILASSMKSYETIIQSIGRILRTHSTKDVAKIFDLVDDLKVTMRTGNIWRSYVNTHWSIREEYYKEKKFVIKTIDIDRVFSILNIDNENTSID